MLDLGRALVDELGLDPGVNTLSRWMAHYIAKLIEDAETAEGEDRASKLAKCADAILDLWKHSHYWSNGKRPFEDLEPIRRALESLDPTDDTPRYFRSQRMMADKTKQNAETKDWLKLANGFDYTAKALIRYCLTQAAQNALDKSKDWVALAEKAGLEDDIDFSVVRFLSAENDPLKMSKPDDIQRELFEDRIGRLDEFKKMAEALASDMRRQLKQAYESNGDS